MIVAFTHEAERDLEDIGDHIALDDPTRTIGLIRELRAKCLGLADMPNRFPLVPHHAAAGVRRCGHGDYLIFYRVERTQVSILHIQHGARDYLAILFPD